jgi:translation initiation factor IF-3
MTDRDLQEPRINEQILRFFNNLPKLREVRLIDENGEQKGVINASKALEMARELSLDLVEIAPTAAPPVCKIVDYGKYKYQQSKKQKDLHNSSKQSDLKILNFGMSIEEHDFKVKVNNAIKFLKHGDKVKILIKFKGREIAYPEFAEKLINRIVEATSEISIIEKPAVLDGKAMSMVIAPKN